MRPVAEINVSRVWCQYILMSYYRYQRKQMATMTKWLYLPAVTASSWEKRPLVTVASVCRMVAVRIHCPEQRPRPHWTARVPATL